MNPDTASFDGGFFKLTLPYTFGGWVAWVLGLVLVGAGIANAVSSATPVGLLLTVLGFLILATASPGSFQADLHRLRKAAMSKEDWENKVKESGLTVENWFLQQTTIKPTNDPNDWVFPAPGPLEWNSSNRYAADPSGKALPEHPATVGTPTPATLSLHGVFAVCAVICLLVFGAALTAQSGSDAANNATSSLVLAALGFILTLVGYFRNKGLRQMLDTPTSLVRSAAVGYPELVGQVRPGVEGAMTVLVDGNERMVVHNMVGYRWTYEQKQCRTVKTDEGTKEECSWVTIRSDSGGVPFILHDGTGGIKVNGTSFKRCDFGQFIQQWSGAFAETLGKQLMASAVAGVLGGARVEGHRWTVYGLRLGDPVYLLGQTKPRPAEELQAEGLDGTLGNSTIEVWGNEDAVGTKVTMKRGTELVNLGTSRSGMEMLLPPIILMLGGLGLLGFL